ncbi:DUF4102 domain-containing protein [Burkholderia cepacia]|nr:DUF4102 domain-containing protein [Burkholderia cepacia]
MPVSHLGADSPDAKAPGPGLRVTAARARSCIFESRLFGKTVRPTIGNIRTRDLGRARTETTRLKTLVDDGKDPRESRAEQQAAHEARQVEARRRDVPDASNGGHGAVTAGTARRGSHRAPPLIVGP